MEKLYYMRVELGRESDAIDKLRSLGLNVSAVEHWVYDYGIACFHDELIAWNENGEYPCVVPYGLCDIIEKCGILVEY